MTNEQILEQRNLIVSQINGWTDKLARLQKNCTHPSATKKSCASTGNYDPSSDVYWDEYTCPICGKYWTEFQ